MYNARGVTLQNTLYYDDYVSTETLHRKLADLYVNYLRNYSYVSKKVQQCFIKKMKFICFVGITHRTVYYL